SAALVALLLRIMAHKPEDRFQSAAELYSALLPFTYPTAEPVSAEVLAALPPAHPLKVAVLLNPPLRVDVAVHASAPNSVAALPVEVSRQMLMMLGAGILGLVLLFALIAVIRAW